MTIDAATLAAWLEREAERHMARAGELGGEGYPRGLDAATRGRECRRLAVLVRGGAVR